MIRTVAAAALACVIGWTPANTAEVRVDMQLVLAVDSSASVDASEFALQINGMAHAFRSPEVIEAIQSGYFRAIGVTLIEWSSYNLQQVDIPWTLVDGPAAARVLAERISSLPRSVETGATSISGALLFAFELFETGPFRGTRRVIDVSCDGRNNNGSDVDLVRNLVLARGITVNGLTILNEHPTLDIYFRRNVIGGSGAFVEVANDYDVFAEAFTRKLVQEIRNVPVAALTPLPHAAPQTATLRHAYR
ncbi:MAG: DUF1194 domain-containing protein [Alphaproteobacteria bacterium]|nr:DUF1194 domain-containing protein [Alphaproteobacteria bacterium]